MSGAFAAAGHQLYQFHASGAHTQRANSILAALSRDSGPTIAEELGALQPALRGTEPSSEVVTRFLRAHTAQFNYLDPHHRLPSIFYDLARYKYSWLTFKCTRPIEASVGLWLLSVAAALLMPICNFLGDQRRAEARRHQGA